MKKNRKRIISGAVCAGLMLMIFFLSAENAEESTETSRFVMRILGVIFSALRLDMNDPAVFAAAHGIVRKLAHFSEYALLGISSGVFFSTFELKKLLRAVCPWVCCFLYACTDEYHQTFIAGRSGEFRDVLIDASGALTGIVLLCAVTALAAYRARKKQCH